MLFKNFDKFSSVLHFSTLKLLLFSCRKSLRFFSAHILKLCVFPQKCAWKTQNADQKLSLVITHNIILANQKTKSFVYHCLPTFPTFVEATDYHFKLSVNLLIRSLKIFLISHLNKNIIPARLMLDKTSIKVVWRSNAPPLAPWYSMAYSPDTW